MSKMNRQILLASRPVGFPKESNFKLVETAVPAPGEGQILVRAIYLSVDPYMRGRMNDVKSYAAPVAIGGVMGGGVVGKVVQSNNPSFKEATSSRAGSVGKTTPCLLYTSPSPRDRQKSRMPSSA